MEFFSKVWTDRGGHEDDLDAEITLEKLSKLQKEKIAFQVSFMNLETCASMNILLLDNVL